MLKLCYGSLVFNIRIRQPWNLIYHDMKWLTATERAGSGLPKSSKMHITAEMSTIAQKLLKRLPLKFENESFVAIKIFKKKFF